MKKDPVVPSKVYMVNLFPILFQKILKGKEKGQTFCPLLHTCSELRLISWDPKLHCGSLVRVGAHGDKVISGVLAKIWLTMGSVSLQIHPVVISSVPECTVEINVFSAWQNPHISSLTCSMRATMLGEPKWKLPLPGAAFT